MGYPESLKFARELGAAWGGEKFYETTPERLTNGEEYFIKIGEEGIKSYPEISGGHTVIDAAGEALPQQPKLQIIGVELTDDPQNNTTKVTVKGGGHLILNRQPVLSDLNNLPEDGVILVYDPNQLYDAQ